MTKDINQLAAKVRGEELKEDMDLLRWMQTIDPHAAWAPVYRISFREDSPLDKAKTELARAMLEDVSSVIRKS